MGFASASATSAEMTKIAGGRAPVGFGPQRRGDNEARSSNCRRDLVPGKLREQARVIRAPVVPVGFGPQRRFQNWKSKRSNAWQRRFFSLRTTRNIKQSRWMRQLRRCCLRTLEFLASSKSWSPLCRLTILFSKPLGLQSLGYQTTEIGQAPARRARLSMCSTSQGKARARAARAGRRPL